MEQMLQTHLIDLLQMATQTDKLETKNERIQTPYPEYETVEVQTDEMEELKGPSRISQATNAIKRAFTSKPKEASTVSVNPEMSQWKEHEGELPVEVSILGT